MNQNAVVGVDIGGTKIAVALFEEGGKLLFKEVQLLNSRKGSEVSNLAIDLVRKMIQEAEDRSFRVKAIGACVPGIYHPARKTVWAPNIPGWEDYPLYEDFEEKLGEEFIDILIESDRSCYILGEVWKGAAQGCNDAIFLSVGTGIGAGILSNGTLITGKSGIGGAVGWLGLQAPYKKKYDACGNFEYYASGNGIARSAIELLKKNPQNDSLLAKLPIDNLSSQEVFGAFAKSDPLATEVIEKAIQYWGMAAANLISIFNPDKVIFGGGVFGPAANLLERIAKEAQKWAQPISIQEVSFHVSSLQGDAGLVGAGFLALKSSNK